MLTLKVAKSQSAMEYLVTYGWAVLIIAVVLAALFQLGVFSGVMSPRAQPGTCRVVRPMGIGTSAYASLQGVCTGLLPLYVAQFNGASSYIDVGNHMTAAPLPQITIAAWIYRFAPASAGQDHIFSNWIGSYHLVLSSGKVYFSMMNASTVQGSLMGATAIQNNKWYFIAGTFDGTTTHVYLNGVVDGSTNNFAGNAIKSSSTDTKIGAGGAYPGLWSQYLFNGLIANVQMYNASLDADEMLALYKEGIGGAPIRVDTLMGWWPLNGNVNDTGGNLNLGAPVNVTYTSSWTRGYPLR